MVTYFTLHMIQTPKIVSFSLGHSSKEMPVKDWSYAIKKPHLPSVVQRTINDLKGNIFSSFKMTFFPTIYASQKPWYLT